MAWLRTVLCCTLALGCTRHDGPGPLHVESWDTDLSDGWAVGDDGRLWRSTGTWLYRDERIRTRWDQHAAGDGGKLLDMALVDDQVVFVGDGSQALVAFTLDRDVWRTQATLPSGARAARYADDRLFALTGEDACGWGDSDGNVRDVPCVESAGLAVDPQGVAAFAAGDALTLVSLESTVVVDFPAARVVWDDAAELFVATSTVGRRVSGIEVDGAVAWETVLDGPIAGLASAPEGVLVTFAVGDVGWTSMLGADGTPVWEMGFPSAVGEVRSSPGNRAFALEELYDGDLHVFVWPSG